jgi:hypothetical protein
MQEQEVGEELKLNISYELMMIKSTIWQAYALHELC